MVVQGAVLLTLLGVVVSGFRLPGRYTSLATFNAALLPQFSQTQERTDLLIDLIQQSNLDVICLQEVWTTNFHRQIYRELRELYPYIVSRANLTAAEETPFVSVCSNAEIQSYGACVMANCSEGSPITCIIRECVHVLEPLTVQCSLCLLINIGASGGIPACAAEPAMDYDTTYGLMLLSKKRLSNGRIEGYLGDASQVRGFIQASIDGVGEVFCTHLSTSLGNNSDYVGPPIPFLYESYAEQQYRELVTLLDMATLASDSSILLGDFNHGPAVATPSDVSKVYYDLPFNYGYVNARGYYSPYVIMDRRCTFCYENPTTSVFSRIIDHIYVPVTSSERTVAAERIWDNQRTATGLPLSDHYGVKLVLRDLTSCSYDWWVCLFREGINTFPLLENPDNELRNICLAVD